eukprot:c17829_g1_i1 orf=287-2431(+)
MVLLLAPSSATARALESSTSAAAFSFAAAPSTNDAASPAVKRQLLDYLLTSNSLRFRFLHLNYPLRKRGSFSHKFCAVSEHQGITSNFNPQLFELARKTASPLISTRLDRAFPSKEALKDGLQAGENGPAVKASNFVLDSPKYRALLPKWKRSLGQFLKSSFSSSLDAPPQAPVPPFTGGLISLLGLVLILGVILDRWIWRSSRSGQSLNGRYAQWEASGPQLSSTGIAMFLRRELRKKESVEWVNMVLGKLWKVYRLGLESWLVGLLQPLIDNLQKPAYVERVEIKQFYLGDEPISVRSVQRRASRRTNDLQYHIGLRYTGGARMLLLLKLKAGFLPIPIPVGVRGLDVDGELWVKLRLVPFQPWVGAATWAFVSLPKIKLDLSPFRLFNLMAIPFLSVFLTKLLTEDLPRLFVRPKKITIDFLKGRTVEPVPKDFKGTTLEGNKNFSGELSVTLVDARNLFYVPYSKTDPYVHLILGDQVIRSKRNSQTSVFGPPGSPIWNQDFQLLVVDPKTQRLTVRVQDYFGLTAITIGVGEVDLSALQDTVPVNQLVKLTGSWGPLEKRFAGELMLRMTYTAYVEDEDEGEEGTPLSSTNGYLSEADENDAVAVPLLKEVVNKAVESAESESSLSNVFAAVFAELNNEAVEDTFVSQAGSYGDASPGKSGEKNGKDFGAQEGEAEGIDGRTALLWLGLVTGLVILVDFSINFSNFLNP